MEVDLMKKVLSLMTVFTLFMTLFIGNSFASDLTEPVFSKDGGVYKEAFNLEIYGGGYSVYYTLDGSEPNSKSFLYDGAIEINPAARSPRTVQGRVAQERIEKGVVVKAVCIDNNGNSSKTVTNTYFVSDKVSEMAESVPVISISTDPKNLWDRREGIYENYDYEHNVPAYIEYFDNNGEGFERGIEIKIGGHGSRSNPKKSIRLYFTKGDADGAKNLKYDFIEGTDKNFYDNSSVKKYGKATLRISDWSESDLKDVVAQKIGEYMRPETANSNPAAIFLNGEFWGIYECREQYDDRYIDYHYEGIDKDDVVYLNRDWTNDTTKSVLVDNNEEQTERITYEEGPEQDEAFYRELFSYTKHLMLNASEGDNYKELSAYMDIDNFIDYIFVYLYTDNIDWPGNNFKFWRTTVERSNGDTYGADGKWRFMIHDFDLAFDNVRNNTLEYAISSRKGDNDARQPSFAAKELDGLFKTEKFRNTFAQRAAAYMSTAVSEENMSKIVGNLISERESVKAYDLMRWNNMSGTSWQRVDSWKSYTENKFIRFASERNTIFYSMIKDFLKKYYESDIDDGANFTFNIDADKASVSVSGAVIRKSFYSDKADSFSTKQFAGIPVEISAETKEGYIVNSITVEDPDGNVSTVTGKSITITPKKGNYTVSFNVSEGNEEISEVNDFSVVRLSRFAKMKVGEKLPIELLTDDGEKLFGFSVSVDSDIVTLGENNVIKAEKSGQCKAVVEFNGIKKEVYIVIS
jgi:hypothetical protein